MHETKQHASLDDEEKEITRHDTEVDLLTRYSPFSNEEDLLAEFDSIAGSGTCIYLYNLCLTEQGRTELSIDDDEEQDDILDVGNNEHQEVKSLKESVFYWQLQNKVEMFLLWFLIFENLSHGFPAFSLKLVFLK